MVHDLDAILAALLDQELRVENVAVSFAAPDDQFPVQRRPADDLVLPQREREQGLHTNQWELERQPDGMTTRLRSPVRVDCSYLITACPSEGTRNPAKDEHRLLPF